MIKKMVVEETIQQRRDLEALLVVGNQRAGSEVDRELRWIGQKAVKREIA